MIRVESSKWFVLMTKKEFILQGFTARTHAVAIQELFEIPDIQRVILSVAFVSESGVDQIAEKLKAYARHVIVFAGIRNDITSHQGLVRLHEIAGGKLYTVDTGSRNVIFHPKLYLVRGKDRGRLVIGSANLTLGGLNNNIEAGMLLDFDMANADDKMVINEIEEQFSALPADYPDHVIKVSSVAELDSMLASGRLVDEMAVPPPRPATSGRGSGGNDTVPRIKLKVVPLRRALAKARTAVSRPRAVKVDTSVKKHKSIPMPAPASVGVEFELVWESKPLAKRDLSIPDAKGTHATGSMSLDAGLLEKEVDFRHYFREEIFSSLSWTPASKTTEQAYAKFHLILKGISYGEFDLRIGHTMGTTNKTYQQNNAVTRLSLGPIHKFIGHPDLIGRTLALYRDKADQTRFVLEID